MNQNISKAHFMSMRSKCDCKNCNSKQKWSNNKYQCRCKKSMKYCVCEKDDAWNPSIYAFEWNKDYEIGEYLKNCAQTKNFISHLVVTCDEIVGMSETASINSSKKNSWLDCDVLLAIPCLLFIIDSVIYHMKHGSSVPYLLPY